jgi:Hint domain
VTLNTSATVDTTLTYSSAGGFPSTSQYAGVVGGELYVYTSRQFGGTTSAATGVYLTSGTGTSFTVTKDVNGNDVITETAACYLRGTQVLTEAGERAVEELKIGDRVMTRFGGLQRIKWIGRHAYRADFARNNLEVIPVLIRAGALGENSPAHDLYVSPGHSMLIKGTLVLAKSLVNGVTVTQSWLPDIYDYFQPELDTHDCILAQGAWSETFADGPGLRDKFQNRAEFDQLYPDHRTPDTLVCLCAPRPERGAGLAAALSPVVQRASAGIVDGALRGFIDRVDGEWRIDGWAQDADHPDLPVLLEVLVAGTVIGSVLACDFRQDLFDVFGHGNSSFVFESPVRLRPELLRTLEVRRARDGAAVQVNENIRPRPELVVAQSEERDFESLEQRTALMANRNEWRQISSQQAAGR